MIERSSIYLYIDSQQRGPYSIDQIRGMLERGEISRQIPAWYEGLKDWMEVGLMLELAPVPSPSPETELEDTSNGILSSKVLVMGVLILASLGAVVWSSFSKKPLVTESEGKSILEIASQFSELKKNAARGIVSRTEKLDWKVREVAGLKVLAPGEFKSQALPPAKTEIMRQKGITMKGFEASSRYSLIVVMRIDGMITSKEPMTLLKRYSQNMGGTLNRSPHMSSTPPTLTAVSGYPAARNRMSDPLVEQVEIDNLLIVDRMGTGCWMVSVVMKVMEGDPSSSGGVLGARKVPETVLAKPKEVIDSVTVME